MLLELATMLNVQGYKLLGGGDASSSFYFKMTIIRFEFDTCFEADLVLNSLRILL